MNRQYFTLLKIFLLALLATTTLGRRVNRKKTTRDAQPANVKLSTGVDVSAFVIKEVHDNDVSITNKYVY